MCEGGWALLHQGAAPLDVVCRCKVPFRSWPELEADPELKETYAAPDLAASARLAAEGKSAGGDGFDLQDAKSLQDGLAGVDVAAVEARCRTGCRRLGGSSSSWARYLQVCSLRHGRRKTAFDFAS